MTKETIVNALCKGCMTPVPCNCGFNEAEYAPQPHQLPLNTILAGKFLLGRVIGEGGFGITYVGWDINLDIRIAVKEYYPHGFVSRSGTQSAIVRPYVSNKDAYTAGRERFMREAKTLAKFSSLSGIVSARDFFQENDTAYLVMEFIDGWTFKDYLKKMGGRLPPAQVFEMMRPVMSALKQVHAAGMIHRDISPDNVMITRDGYMKLLDFGAAQAFDDGDRSRTALMKPGYTPEEQTRTRGKQGPWTDIYALCATMYRAITGSPPDEAGERVLDDQVQTPSVLGIAMLPDQEAALMRGMAVRGEDRWPDIDPLLTILEPRYGRQVVTEEKAKEPEPPMPLPPSPQPPGPAAVNPWREKAHKNLLLGWLKHTNMSEFHSVMLTVSPGLVGNKAIRAVMNNTAHSIATLSSELSTPVLDAMRTYGRKCRKSIILWTSILSPLLLLFGILLAMETAELGSTMIVVGVSLLFTLVNLGPMRRVIAFLNGELAQRGIEPNANFNLGGSDDAQAAPPTKKKLQKGWLKQSPEGKSRDLAVAAIGVYILLLIFTTGVNVIHDFESNWRSLLALPLYIGYYLVIMLPGKKLQYRPLFLGYTAVILLWKFVSMLVGFGNYETLTPLLVLVDLFFFGMSPALWLLVGLLRKKSMERTAGLLLLISQTLLLLISIGLFDRGAIYFVTIPLNYLYNLCVALLLFLWPVQERPVLPPAREKPPKALSWLLIGHGLLTLIATVAGAAYLEMWNYSQTRNWGADGEPAIALLALVYLAAIVTFVWLLTRRKKGCLIPLGTTLPIGVILFCLIDDDINGAPFEFIAAVLTDKRAYFEDYTLFFAFLFFLAVFALTVHYLFFNPKGKAWMQQAQPKD